MIYSWQNATIKIGDQTFPLRIQLNDIDWAPGYRLLSEVADGDDRKGDYLVDGTDILICINIDSRLTVRNREGTVLQWMTDILFQRFQGEMASVAMLKNMGEIIKYDPEFQIAEVMES